MTQPIARPASSPPAGSGRRRFPLLGLDLDDCTLAEAASAISQAIESGEVGRVASFVNAHCFNVARRHAEYRRAVRAATWRFPDGTGVRWAARFFGHSMRDNPNGTDLFPFLCDRAAACGHRMFFLGGRPGVAERMARRLKATWPDLLIAGTLPGDFEESHAGPILEAIQVSRPDLLFVAGGVPVQEIWIERYRSHLRVPVILGVGGLFDFFAEHVSRAPALLRRTGFEWTWRLLQEPQRLWRRYLLGNPDFLAWVAWERLRNGTGLPAERLTGERPIALPRSTPVRSEPTKRTPR